MRVAEISYGVAGSMQGMGIATQAVRMVLDRVFEQTALRRVIAYVHEHNAASCRVLEKLGFKREGLLREHYLIRGEPVNEWVFGILAREWVGRG
jgi:[ribosomal protein S5]-alanine N-acetyltransferase